MSSWAQLEHRTLVSILREIPCCLSLMDQQAIVHTKAPILKLMCKVRDGEKPGFTTKSSQLSVTITDKQFCANLASKPSFRI